MLGIGGKTIEEAKENLSADEFFSWVAYRNKRGPLSISQRIDRIGALLAVVHGGGKMKDYMPWSKDDPVPQKPFEFTEEAMKKIDSGFKVDHSRNVEIRNRKVLNLEKEKSQKTVLKKDKSGSVNKKENDRLVKR